MWTEVLTPYASFALPVASAALALAVVAVVLLIWAHRRLTRLMLGRSGASLEESIVTLTRRTKDLETFRIELEAYLKRAEIRLSSSIRGFGTVRFNPFKGDGSGGDQSFATALLTEEGNGVVFSTLYSRDRVSMFGKPIAKGTSTYELTDEERQALKLAQDTASK